MKSSDEKWRLAGAEGWNKTLEAAGWGEVRTDNNCSLDELLQISGASVQLSPFTFAKLRRTYKETDLKEQTFLHSHTLIGKNRRYVHGWARRYGEQPTSEGCGCCKFISKYTTDFIAAVLRSGASTLAELWPPGRWAQVWMFPVHFWLDKELESRSCDGMRKEGVKDDEDHGLLFFFKTHFSDAALHLLCDIYEIVSGYLTCNW